MTGLSGHMAFAKRRIIRRYLDVMCPLGYFRSWIYTSFKVYPGIITGGILWKGPFPQNTKPELCRAMRNDVILHMSRVAHTNNNQKKRRRKKNVFSLTPFSIAVKTVLFQYIIYSSSECSSQNSQMHRLT